MDRISTYNLNTLSIGGALKSQSQWAKAELQQSSGLISEDFGGLGGQSTTRVLSLEHDIEQAQTWSADATAIESRTESMYSAIGNMTSLMTQLRTTISSAISSSDRSNLLAQVQTIQNSLVSAMNTQVNGTYLFSGSNTTVAPVSLTNYPTTPYDATVSDTSYYTGDSTVQSVRVSSVQTINYGVTGNSTGFEEAMRAVESVKQVASSLGTMTNTQITDALGQAMSLATKATTDLSNQQAVVSSNATTLKNIAQQQKTYVTYLQDSLSDVKNVDAAEVAARVATLKTQLTASYSAVSDISQMSLVKYL